MTLPTTGQISLNQVNVELGKAGNSLITLNDSAVRSLAGVASGGLGMNSLYGKSAAPSATHTVTSVVKDPYGFGNVYGYTSGAQGSSAQGAISPTTFKGIAIFHLCWFYDFMLSTYTLNLAMNNSSLNQGWLTSLKVGGVTYAGSSAFFGNSAGGYPYSQWQWVVASNPLPVGSVAVTLA